MGDVMERCEIIKGGSVGGEWVRRWWIVIYLCEQISVGVVAVVSEVRLKIRPFWIEVRERPIEL